ncbi:hypothetical protein QLG35_11060 [Staphylococcus aureus]|uniref:hypothetical protein n=1 Tax=Staphylococcus aureus TaxID=1280 RepID=UPI00288FC8FA|nr:hypothetical protein [Staphylococcus aureus]MDT3056744.1 hypothetical protein [Staphylococcus aureus]
MCNPKIRVSSNTYEQLEILKKDLNLKAFDNVLSHLLEHYHNSNNTDKSVEQTLKKILDGVNYNSKQLSLLEEFSNTASQFLMFDENKGTNNEPSDWYKQAKVEVENKIQTKRTKKLSETKED